MRRIAIGLCLAAACAHPRAAAPNPQGVVPVAFHPPAAEEAVVEDRVASFDHYRLAVERAAAGDAEGALVELEAAVQAWPANRAARVAYLKIHPNIDPTRPHKPFTLVDSVTDIEVRLRLIGAHLNFVYRCIEGRDYSRAADACDQILWLAPDYTVARMLKLDAAVLARDPGRHDAVAAKIAGLRLLAGETEFGIPRGEEVGAPEPGVLRAVFEPLLQQARNDVPGDDGMTPAEVARAGHVAPHAEVRLEVYDVQDMTQSLCDFGCKLSIHPEERGHPPTSDELADTILREVDPTGWDRPHRSIQAHQGLLIVRSTPAVHAAVAATLARERAAFLTRRAIADADQDSRCLLDWRQMFCEIQNDIRRGRRFLDDGDSRGADACFTDAATKLDSVAELREEFILLRAELDGLIERDRPDHACFGFHAWMKTAFAWIASAQVTRHQAPGTNTVEGGPHAPK